MGIQSEIMMNDVGLSFFCIILHLHLQRACKPLHLLNNTDVSVPNGATRARILKHLLEAEKSTFRGEPSFERSECTAELSVATFFVLYLKDFSV